MPFESSTPQELSPKNVFIETLNNELLAMEKSGQISSEQAEEKRQAAALIEEGFSADPAHDALIFSRAGIAGEKEMVDILNKTTENTTGSPAPETETIEHQPIAEILDRAQAEGLLKQAAFSLGGLGEKIKAHNALPGKYNENQGVVVFSNKEGAFALPASPETRRLLEAAEYSKDERIGVPNLNDSATWSEAQKASGASFDKWKKIVESSLG